MENPLGTFQEIQDGVQNGSDFNKNISCTLDAGTVSVLCRECLWVVVDLKRRY